MSYKIKKEKWQFNSGVTNYRTIIMRTSHTIIMIKIKTVDKSVAIVKMRTRQSLVKGRFSKILIIQKSFKQFFIVMVDIAHRLNHDSIYSLI